LHDRQSEDDVALVDEEKVPATQLTQAADPEEDQRPAEHALQRDELVAFVEAPKVPAGH
jgi:hypothetical protein